MSPQAWGKMREASGKRAVRLMSLIKEPMRYYAMKSACGADGGGALLRIAFGKASFDGDRAGCAGHVIMWLHNKEWAWSVSKR